MKVGTRALDAHVACRNAVLEPEMVLTNYVHTVAWIPDDQDWIITAKKRYSDLVLYNLLTTRVRPDQSAVPK
jgi:hypothetical protein